MCLYVFAPMTAIAKRKASSCKNQRSIQRMAATGAETNIIKSDTFFIEYIGEIGNENPNQSHTLPYAKISSVNPATPPSSRHPKSPYRQVLWFTRYRRSNTETQTRKTVVGKRYIVGSSPSTKKPPQLKTGWAKKNQFSLSNVGDKNWSAFSLK